jgi:hypothetical protein
MRNGDFGAEQKLCTKYFVPSTMYDVPSIVIRTLW